MKDLHDALILSDMDGVLFEWDPELNRQLLLIDPAFPVVEPVDRTGYDHFGYGTYDRSVVTQAMDASDFYANLTPVPGAVEALLQMEDAGLEVALCSSPTWTNTGCANGKKETVDAHLGPKWVDRMILTKDKTLVHGDILIDDKPTVTGLRAPSWKHLLFTRPYNVSTASPHRMDGWANWREDISLALGALPATV